MVASQYPTLAVRVICVCFRSEYSELKTIRFLLIGLPPNEITIIRDIEQKRVTIKPLLIIGF